MSTRRVELHVQEMARDMARRKAMLIAAFMAETGRPLGKVELVQEGGPLQRHWRIQEREQRRTFRAWLLQTGLSLSPRWRARLKRLADEFHALGLKASETWLFLQTKQGRLEVSWAKRETLQVRCHLCKARVALDDWQKHLRGRHME